MKKTYLMAIMAAAIVLPSAAAWAQHTGRPPARPQPPQAMPGIAVIDIQYIFKNYSLHKANKEALKSEFQRINGEVKNERAAIRTLIERLKEFRPGTPNYKAAEEEAATREAKLTVRMKILQREFAEKEAKMLYTTYQAVRGQVSQFCQANRIMMVLQSNRDPDNPTDPNAILQVVAKPVVWHGGCDITEHILRDLESRYHGNRTPNPNAPQNTTPLSNRAGVVPRR